MMSNKYLIDSFKTLRVYRKHSFPEIMNHLICNRIMKNKAIVNHSAFLYQLSIIQVYRQKLYQFYTTVDLCQNLYGWKFDRGC